MKSGNILIVEHDKTLLHVQGDVLKKAGYDVSSAINGEDALVSIREQTPDIILTELALPRMSGIDLIKAVKNIDSAMVCIVITGHGSIESTVEAMKAGAYTYLTKPLKMNEFLVAVDNALEVHGFNEGSGSVRRNQNKDFKNRILGKSNKIHDVFALIDAVADTDSTVLILGESGTGKELVAKSIHYQSNRRDKLIVPINCGAIPENLLESELFGHVKGAFTGAVSSKPGLFELADKGSIFLDEIGDMPLVLQVKLLRVIQEREFRNVGSTEDIKTNVRIIAASNKNLEKAIEDGEFREDLYYRLNVIQIKLPPLRERKDDIAPLVNHFIAKHNKELERNIRKISSEALQVLERYPFQGNVRELGNIIERAVALEQGDMIMPESFPDEVREGTKQDLLSMAELPTEGVDIEKVMEDVEKDLILKALNMTNGVKIRAAKLLKVSFRSFRYRLAKYGLDD